MAKFTVIGLVDATTFEEVEAHSAEKALDQAVLSASVCYQCAESLEVGDVYDAQVINEEGEVVLEFNEEKRRKNMKKTLEEILKEADTRNMKWLQKLVTEGLK